MTELGGVAGWMDGLLGRSLAGRVGDVIRADLREEMERRSARSGRGAARRWYVWQAGSVLFWSLLDRLRGRGWRTGGRGMQTAGRGGADPGSRPDGSRFDLRDPVRVFRRSPGYAFAVVGTLGLAMAATLSVATVVDRVLLTELPWFEPDRMVRIDGLRADGEAADGAVSHPDFLDWQRELDSFEGLAAWMRFEGIYLHDGIAEEWRGVSGTAELLPLVGVRPSLGAFAGEETWEIGENVLFLSHELWTSRFGRDPGVVGTTITLSEASWEVRGVMPPDFAFPESDIDVWVPLRQAAFMENRRAGFLRVLGRLTPGTSIEVARAEFESVAAAIDEQHGSEKTGRVVQGWADVLLAPVRRTLWIFLAAVGFFLLTACTNVVGLTLSRVEARRREFAVRLSLGATRRRVRAQLLLESGALGLAGGVVGAVGAWGGVRLLLALAPAELPRREEIALDPQVVLTGVAVSILCGLVIGLAPRLGAGMGPGSQRARRGESRIHALVAGAQVAIAVVLLTGSGLLLRSFQRLTSVETGVAEPEQVLTMEIGLGRERWGESDRISEFHARLLEQVRAIPGVRAAATSTHLPFSGASLEAATLLDDVPFTRGVTPNVRIEVVNGDYWETLGIRLEGSDPLGEEGAREVVVNRAALATLGIEGPAIGREISFYADPGVPAPPEFRYRIVGVVPDVLDDELGAESAPRGYYRFDEFRHLWQFVSGRFFYLSVRTAGDPYQVLPAVRRAVAELDVHVPVQGAMTLEARMLDTASTQRFRTLVLTLFGVLAILVSLIGVHGVIAFGVRRGMREIGVRFALGASRSEVRGRVLRRAAWMAAGGGAVGLAGAVLLGSTLERFLFDVGARDPVTFGAVVGVALAGCLLAALPSAVRAARVDPVEVMREE